MEVYIRFPLDYRVLAANRLRRQTELVALLPEKRISLLQRPLLMSIKLMLRHTGSHSERVARLLMESPSGSVTAQPWELTAI